MGKVDEAGRVDADDRLVNVEVDKREDVEEDISVEDDMEALLVDEARETEDVDGIKDDEELDTATSPTMTAQSQLVSVL